MRVSVTLQAIVVSSSEFEKKFPSAPLFDQYWKFLSESFRKKFGLKPLMNPISINLRFSLPCSANYFGFADNINVLRYVCSSHVNMQWNFFGDSLFNNLWSLTTVPFPERSEIRIRVDIFHPLFEEE